MKLFKQPIIDATRQLFLFTCLHWLLLSCQPGQSAAGPCPLGEPTPVFSSGQDYVEAHHFIQNGQESEEQIRFSDGLDLTIRQTGCKSIRQDYLFSLPHTPSASDQFWIEKGAALLARLGDYSENFYAFKAWSAKIREFKSEFRLTEPYEIAPGIYVKIDRIIDQEVVLLIITLQQAP